MISNQIRKHVMMNPILKRKIPQSRIWSIESYKTKITFPIQGLHGFEQYGSFMIFSTSHPTKNNNKYTLKNK